MRALAPVILLLVLAAASAPEVMRYAAERQLYRASAVLQLFFARPQDVPRPDETLAWAASIAAAAARHLPGDWRPLNLAGSARLFARRPEQAVETYRQALVLGERPELDVNLARAYSALGRRDLARRALLRAAWISPPILEGFSSATQAAIRPELEELERQLVAGTLAAPPPPP